MAGSAWTNQVQNQVIVAGADSGIFVYAGPPAAGNLIASISSAPGTDPYGNTYPGGILGQLETNEIQFLSGSNVVGQLAPVGVGAVPPLTLLNEPFASTAGTAANPSLVTTDTWHNMNLLNSWVVLNSNYYARYQLMADGSVWIQGRIANGTATGGTSIWAPPAAYTPTITPAQAIPVTVENTAGAATAASPRLDITSTGALLQNAASSTVVSFNGRYSLT